MNKLLTAIALTIAFPAVANAQTAPAPASAKMDCSEMMKAGGMDGHKNMHGMMDAKGGHVMKPMQPGAQKSGAKQPQTEQQHNQH